MTDVMEGGSPLLQEKALLQPPVKACSFDAPEVSEVMLGPTASTALLCHGQESL